MMRDGCRWMSLFSTVLLLTAASITGGCTISAKLGLGGPNEAQEQRPLSRQKTPTPYPRAQ